MDKVLLVSLIAGFIGTALITGLLYAFSVCVMKALSELPAAEGIRAMQSINRVIQNRQFFGVFFGTTVLSLVNGLSIVSGLTPNHSRFFISASVIYLFGVFAITAIGNVPLNNKLDALDAESGNAFWATYLKKWTRLNHLRSAFGVISIGLYAVGFIEMNLQF